MHMLLNQEVEGWVFRGAVLKFMTGLGSDWQPLFSFISDFTDAFRHFNDNTSLFRASQAPTSSPSKYAPQAANWHSGTVISLSQESSVHGKPLKSFLSAIVKKDTFVSEEMCAFGPMPYGVDVKCHPFWYGQQKSLEMLYWWYCKGGFMTLLTAVMIITTVLRFCLIKV